jgi:hypothetical protein
MSVLLQLPLMTFELIVGRGFGLDLSELTLSSGYRREIQKRSFRNQQLYEDQKD